MNQWAIRLGIGIVVVILAFMLGVAGWVASRFYLTLPQTRGTIELEGYTGQATVVRDENGVAHIFGDSDADVYYALGYTHASERFFQMDLARRLIQGRLSELVGERAMRSDALARIRRYHLASEAVLANASDETRAVLQAYAAGVNARLAQGTPAPEYAVLRVSPDEWQLVDSAAMTIYMADMLAAGWSHDWAKTALEDQLNSEQLYEFLNEIPDWAPTTLKNEDVQRAYSDINTSVLPLPEALPPAEETVEPGNPPGSNAWIVSGDWTSSGRPLLASDPHLSLGAPSIWYHARLNLSDGPVIGVTSPGTPFVIMGRNSNGAWAYTNTGFDVIDLVPVSRNGLQTSLRTEIIEVRGKSPVELVVEDTADGPVLDPRYFNLEPYDEDDAVILRSTVQDPSNDMLDVAIAIMHSNSWDSFVEASRGWTAPMQNMHYAGVDGTIGYTTAGLMPIRDEDGNWTGFIPFDELPRISNPEGGMIASGNNPVAPDAYPYALPGRYSVYRAARIEPLIDSYERHDQETFRAIQMDEVSLQAREILPTLLGARPETQLGIEALAKLERWDGTMRAEGPEGLIYSAWIRTLSGMIWADELGEWAPDFVAERRVFIAEVLTGDAYTWCDDVRSPQTESCAEMASLSLDFAMMDLESRYGRNIDSWSWGEAHQAMFDHPAMTGLPIIGDTFTVRTPIGGDGSTVNVAHFSYRNENFDAVHGPSMRAIYDLADLNRSLFMHAPGQSGHPWSRHYRDLADRWAAGEYYEIRDDWNVDTRPEGARVLRLVPAPQQ